MLSRATPPPPPALCWHAPAQGPRRQPGKPSFAPSDPTPPAPPSRRLAFVAALGAELSTGETVLRQLADEPTGVILAAIAFITASLIPLLNSTKREAFGPFTPAVSSIGHRTCAPHLHGWLQAGSCAFSARWAAGKLRSPQRPCPPTHRLRCSTAAPP